MPSLGSMAAYPIHIPGDLPKILKQYTKAAIRTQPADLLLWSASYFRCLANGEIPPVKDRLEYPPPDTRFGLTPGLLRVLHKQLGHQEHVELSLVQAKWHAICLDQAHLDGLLAQAGLMDQVSVEWKAFLLHSAMLIAGSSVESCMAVLCTVLAQHPDGMSTSLPDHLFIQMLRRICEQRRDLQPERIDLAVQYFSQIGVKQQGLLSMDNFKAFDCPRFA